MVKGLLVKTTKFVEPMIVSDFDSMKMLIGVDIAERVVNHESGMEMWCDEDAYRKGSPVNLFASVLYRSLYPDTDHLIRGDVFVCRVDSFE